MLAIQGYYDGQQIVLNENIKLAYGQQVIVTVLDNVIEPPKKNDAERIEKHFNNDTMEALNEVAYMKKHPNEFKGYTDVDLMMEELLK